MTDLNTLKTDLIAQVEAAPDAAALEAIRISALGKSGQTAVQLGGFHLRLAVGDAGRHGVA